ncbi:PD40 domain-containing protein [Streptomyces sp. TLI_171]|uniref:PD40 domain-containing protein n=1 Tax=Streptomyces sp. TLI_171 TaxID=1938859 RepID=UPI000C196944|nr:PD40 domain-containing protein [Streptomyces sp. TLI_171]RKE17240.1 WD40 repeat protein [Streptomyces sp. TLI_171]
MKLTHRAYAFAAAAALALPLVAGCTGSSGGAAGTAPSSSGGSAAGQDAAGGSAGDATFRGKDLVLSAGCTVPASRPATVWVQGFDPATWKKVASVEFTLPAQAVLGKRDGEELSALYSLCAENLPHEEPDGGLAVSDLAFGPRVRQLFDRDFSKLAVVTADDRTGARHVGYVDRAGKFTDLTGDDNGFAATPKEQDALFAPDGGSVWFTHLDAAGQQHVASRSTSGAHQLTEQWSGERPATLGTVLLLGGSPLRGVLGSSPRFSPDGTRVADFVYGSGRGISPVAASGPLPAKDVVHLPDYECQPSGWVDNHTLLCAHRESGAPAKHLNNFWTVDVDRLRPEESATPTDGAGPDLLPVTDRQNLPLAVSPDGKRLLFRSVQGKVEQPYVTALAPGSQPQQITPEDAATALGYGDVVLEWR